MYIDRTARSYYRGTEQRIAKARFLILVSLGLERTEETCTQCSGFGRYIDAYDLDDDLNGARVKPCYHCIPIRCTACDGKGWTYDESKDEHAQTCGACSGKGDLGPSGMQVHYIHHKEIRALVRRVAMHQCGHFMMGSAEAFGHRLSLSGSYGGDGLTVTVPREVFEKAVPIPQELHDAWNNGGGWNSAGSEAPKMVEWALANLDKLEPPRKRKR